MIIIYYVTTGGNFVRARVTERIRVFHALVSRDVSCDKRGKFCKHLKGFKTKINRMSEENFAAFFVLLAFIELSFTVTSLTGETNSNKRETRALA